MEGARVIVNYSGNDKSADETVAHIICDGGQAEKYKCQVDSYEETEKMIAYIIDKYERIDVLVNNAGITLPACPIEEISPEQWKKVLDIDLMGTIYGTQCVIPVMRKNGGGKIINMASIAGQVGGVFTEATYPVSKAGVICFAKAVAKQVGKDNIT